MKSQVRILPPESGYIVSWPEPDVVEIDVCESDDIYRRVTCRVFGMNGPEPRGATLASADRTRTRGEELTLTKTLKFIFMELPPNFLVPPRFKKYGRTVVRVILPDGSDIADVLVDEGYAVPYFMGLGKPEPLSRK